MNLGCQNIVLTIGNKERKIAAVLRCFGLFLHFDVGPRGPNVSFRVPIDQQDRLLGRGGHQG